MYPAQRSPAIATFSIFAQRGMQKTRTVKAGKDRAHEDPTDVYKHLMGRDEDEGARLSSEESILSASHYPVTGQEATGMN